MPDSNGNPTVFSTRKLDSSLVQKLEEASIALIQDNFINIEYSFDPSSFESRLNNTDTQARIFTSKNALVSLQQLARQRPVELIEKRNFVVGLKATEMLNHFGVRIDARAGNAISLAQIIARNKDVKSVDFFCGDKALNDLPEYLESKGIKVNKEIVYKTELVPKVVETETLDGAIFLSPTATYSFFKKNKLPRQVPAFCIGATTSEAVHLRCNNKRIVADEPSIESVVDKVIESLKYDPN